jgi:class 3 adenylate cyclase
VATRLAGTMLAVGLASLLAATLVGVDAGQRLGRAIVDATLASSQSSGAREVGAQLAHYQRLAQQMATSPQAATAIQEFSDAFRPLRGSEPAELAEIRQQLLESYEELYFEPLRELGQVVQVRDVLSSDPAALYLQGAYSRPLPPVDDPSTVDDAGDGSTWSQVHARYHPTYRTAAREADLRDVYLVDADTERIVYSSAKGPDLGTSLAVGPYSGTVVARAVDAAVSSEEAVVTDLSFYRAAPGVPIGAAAAAVRDGLDVVGAIVLTYDASIFTERLSSLAATAADTDTGSTGQMYVVGADGTTRSNPQAFVLSPSDYLDDAVAAGVLTTQDRDSIERAGTTVLIQPAVDATVNSARAGDTDPHRGTGIDGSDVVYGVEPVANDDVTWSVVREVGTSTVESAISVFRRILLVGSALFVVGLAFAAVAWATRFLRPVRIISARLGRSALADLGDVSPEPVVIPERSSVELHRLAETFTDMGNALVRQRRAVVEARARRLDVMRRTLPPAVAQRIARGDVEAVEQVASVTVAVVVVLGLGRLLSVDPAGARRTLDELHREIDALADEHGVDRIKVVGDAYFAACGHDRPYIDHAPRVVAFATDVVGAVAAGSGRAGVRLDATIGITSGPVSVGMTGGDRLVYDVWGPTVTTAHTLARSARAGEVVITDVTRRRLPGELAVSPWLGAPGAAHTGETSASTVWVVQATAPAPASGEAEVVS